MSMENRLDITISKKSRDRKESQPAAASLRSGSVSSGCHHQPRRWSLWASGRTSQVDPREKDRPKSQRSEWVLRSGSDRQTLIRQHRLVRGLNLAASPGAGDTDRYPGVPSHAHPPSSLPPRLLPACQTPGPSRLLPAEPTWARAGRGGCTDVPPAPQRRSDREGGEPAGTRRTPETRAGRGLGRRSLGCPHPPGRSEPLSSLRADKRPTAGDPHPQPGPREGRSRGRGGGSLYPAPRLRVPGPRLRTDGPPDNGPRGCGWGRPGLALRDRAPQAGGGQLRAKPRGGGAEGGRRCETDKAQRQTDGRTEGEKMATRAAGARCSRTGSGREFLSLPLT
ncbi:serine/arginine repetitive matrix protein 3-like [Pipistrellus kuhlii]|uniref:serine/arginine repetitive matrix protein 3-like n=1 Tax=Pipistrellus kuhlii TaxID=59472 RepID=UPI001E271D5A|nr:serine/arginine repetitive matrix protein 3-like [Pipistrellus kuhlii]